MSVIEDDAGGGSARQSGTPRSLREQVVAIGERWTAAQYRLVGLVVELDRSGEWAADGAVTCAHWIADALGVEVSTGREWLRIGRALELLPEIEASFGSGRLSYSKVRTLTRIATPDHEAELCRLALDVPAGRLGPVLAAWLAGHEEPEETDHRQRAGTMPFVANGPRRHGRGLVPAPAGRGSRAHRRRRRVDDADPASLA